MKKFIYGLLSILVILLLIILAFGLELGSLKWKGYFAPKHEAVRRKVFKETRSFNEGKIQQLAKYRLEYLRAPSVEEKQAIASTIRMNFADYDYTKLNGKLKSFLMEVIY